MKKVIVKVKLANHDRFKRKMDEIGMEFSPIYYTHDRVYVPRGYKRGMNLPRLVMRTEVRAVDKPAKYSLILKRHIEDSDVDIVEDTPIKDYADMANIITQLGFKMQKEVARRRQECSLGDGVMMYIDNIEGINGYFGKIEVDMNEDDKVSVLQDDARNTFSVLGEKNFIENAYFED